MQIMLPNLAEIYQAQKALEKYILPTPIIACRQDIFKKILGEKAEVYMKLEFLQVSGSFKIRGALCSLMQLDQEQIQRGVVAVSGGNHGVSVAYAAHQLKIPCKVIFPKQTSPVRIKRCQDYGANVLLVSDLSEGFAVAKQMQEVMIHPYDGHGIVLGTATLAMEVLKELTQLDAIVVAVGGGGLCAGMVLAKQFLQSDCQVYGVEPEGACAMFLSLQNQRKEILAKTRTIADTLAAPSVGSYPFAICQSGLKEVVCISDNALREAMRVIYHEFKFAVEPACVAAMAGVLGPLKEKLANKKIAIIMCGSNMDYHDYARCIEVLPAEYLPNVA